MKPISEWTVKQKNHFLTLFIGECWHEWANAYDYCTKCHKTFEEIFADKETATYNDFCTDLSGFQKVMEYCEKEYPELWDDYQWWTIFTLDNNRENKYYRTIELKNILNLDNFIIYILGSEEEWGWKECPSKEFCNEDYDETLIPPHKFCGQGKHPCEGKLKHPAIQWAEEEGLI